MLEEDRQRVGEIDYTLAQDWRLYEDFYGVSVAKAILRLQGECHDVIRGSRCHTSVTSRCPSRSRQHESSYVWMDEEERYVKARIF
jgi:hypothetical protein